MKISGLALLAIIIILPMAILRPISGSSTVAVATELIKQLIK